MYSYVFDLDMCLLNWDVSRNDTRRSRWRDKLENAAKSMTDQFLCDNGHYTDYVSISIFLLCLLTVGLYKNMTESQLIKKKMASSRKRVRAWKTFLSLPLDCLDEGKLLIEKLSVVSFLILIEGLNTNIKNSDVFLTFQPHNESFVSMKIRFKCFQ